jgi:hypothetical protein
VWYPRPSHGPTTAHYSLLQPTTDHSSPLKPIAAYNSPQQPNTAHYSPQLPMIWLMLACTAASVDTVQWADDVCAAWDQQICYWRKLLNRKWNSIFTQTVQYFSHRPGCSLSFLRNIKAGTFWKIYTLQATVKIQLYLLTYKVVKIWPGQTVTCLHTNSPGHIWTTLYKEMKFEEWLLHYIE